MRALRLHDHVSVDPNPQRGYGVEQEHPSRRARPRCVTLYDGEAKILRTVLIDEPDGEPQHVEPR
jgi:hypothetical protein